MWVLGHRGNSAHFPENTLAAFHSALFDTDADGIELDVYCSRDNQLVVIHDESLERTTNGKGYVHHYTVEELTAFDAGNGESIPTLAEILRFMPQHKWLNIELKGENTAKALIALLNTTEFCGWQKAQKLLISSFNHHLLQQVNSALPSLKIGALTASIPINYAQFASELNAWSIHCDKQFITQAFINDAKAKSLQVFVYTVDLPSDIQKLKSLGVNAIFSNDPQAAKSSL